MSVVKVFDDLKFTVIAEAQSHSVDFKIYDIASYDTGTKVPMYEVDINKQTTEIDKALVFAHGFVKWDGCSNWFFDTQEEGMIHGCSRSDIERIGAILAECWDWTVELCPQSICCN